MERLQAVGPNAAQIERWNGATGETWAKPDFREQQDKVIGPYGDDAMDTLRLQSGQYILDIGCGSGTTTLKLANRVGPSGRVIGVDISTPQLENAKKRADELADLCIEFHNHDMTTFPFEGSLFDCAFSRFGVMFFAEPVDAFTHIRSGIKPSGRLAFACWKSAEQNPWLSKTVEVASQYLPRPAAPGPTDPGPYSFQDSKRINLILTEAGFSDIEIVSVEKGLTCGPDMKSTVAQLIQVGAMAAAIEEAPEELRNRIKSDLGEAFQGYQTSSGVIIDSAAWIVSATNPR